MRASASAWDSALQPVSSLSMTASSTTYPWHRILGKLRGTAYLREPVCVGGSDLCRHAGGGLLELRPAQRRRRRRAAMTSVSFGTPLPPRHPRSSSRQSPPVFPVHPPCSVPTVASPMGPCPSLLQSLAATPLNQPPSMHPPLMSSDLMMTLVPHTQKTSRVNRSNSCDHNSINAHGLLPMPLPPRAAPAAGWCMPPGKQRQAGPAPAPPPPPRSPPTDPAA